MSGSWTPFFFTPPNFKSVEPVNLIPIMNSPLKSPKQEANSLEFSQQPQSQHQRTLRQVGPSLPRYHTGVPVHTTYINSLNLSFSQPGAYSISINLNSDVTMTPEAASQAAAIMDKPAKPTTDMIPTQRTRTPGSGPTDKAEEPPAVLPTVEPELFRTAIDNPFGNETETRGTFYGYGA